MKKDFNTAFRKGIEADRIRLSRRRKQILREVGLSEELASAEIAEELKVQIKANGVLSKTIEEKDRVIEEKTKEIKALGLKVAELEKRLSSLSSESAKSESNPVVKTSANSSVPPSKNPIGVPHTQSLRVPSGKKTGGQKGHKGSTRLQSANVTRFTNWYPVAVCPICGRPLDMASAKVYATRQVIDIPIPVFIEVVNHYGMKVKCSCGHCYKGEFPENVNAPVSYGPNIKALVSYLSTYQNIPFKRMSQLFKDLFGIHMSEGTISNILNSMTKLSEPAYEMIRQAVVNGSVAGADETGVNVNGKNHWDWSFQNSVAVYLTYDKSRGHDVLNNNFTMEELGGKVWVTDRWPAYFMDDVGMDDHQICIAHLLRNLMYTNQAFKDDPWSADMLELLRTSVHCKNKGDFGQAVRTEMDRRLDELLARPPVYTKADGTNTELDTLKNSLIKHRDYIFTFLTNPDVPPKNNDSEKSLRPIKTKLKVSGCFRTDGGAENYATVASVIQTAVKNGRAPFNALRLIAKQE